MRNERCDPQICTDSHRLMQARVDRLPLTESHMPRYPGTFPIAVHPGEILREMIEEHRITQSRLARHLGMDVARVNEICRGRRGVSAQMALMLARAFGTSPQLWLNLQKNWELSQVDPKSARHVRPLRASA